MGGMPGMGPGGGGGEANTGASTNVRTEAAISLGSLFYSYDNVTIRNYENKNMFIGGVRGLQFQDQ